MTSAVRIALCFGTYPPEHNGGSDYVANLARALAAEGLQVLVLTSPSDGAAEQEEELPGVRVARIVEDWRALTRKGRRSFRRANRLLAAEGVQVVHVFFPDSVFQGRYQVAAALGLGRVPLVSTFWNLGLGSRSPTAVRLESLALLARSRVLTSHDPAYLRLLERLSLGRRPVLWLPAGSNIPLNERPSEPREQLSLKAGLDPHARYLAYFGQLDATRGVEDLFVALAEVREREDVRLLMVGSAGRPERYRDGGAETWAEFHRLRSLPKKLGVEEAVVWTDYLPGQDVAALLGGADCCVLPYRKNSVGRSALAAALELGLPTVLAGTPETVKPLLPGRHVLLVPPRRPDELAVALTRLVADADERQRLADGALQAARLFAWPRIAAAARGAYTRALQPA
jgi:glycosyltransferase involved in cell wall biosynthesis